MDNFKNEYIGLVFDCPFFERICEECPMKNLKKMSFKDRIKKFDNFTEKEKNQILTKHYKLYTLRSKYETHKIIALKTITNQFN